MPRLKIHSSFRVYRQFYSYSVYTTLHSSLN